MDNGETKVRVAIVEDQTIVCDLMADFLSQEPNLCVTVKANRGSEFLAALETSRVDLAFLDIGLPDISGIELLTRVKRTSKRTRVIMVTAVDRASPLREAMAAGADGIVSKSAPLTQLGVAVRTVLAGGVYIDPDAGAVLRRSPGTTEDPISTREREVAILVARGFTTKEIAEKLDISPKTVTNHRTALMRKIGAHNSADITRHVTDQRWI